MVRGAVTPPTHGDPATTGEDITEEKMGQIDAVLFSMYLDT